MAHRILATAVVMLVSCGGDPAATVEPIEKAESLQLQIAYQALCDARTLSETGDVWGAANEFMTQAHAFLHELADRLSATDREAAARLLEAKEAVEIHFSAPDEADPAATARSLSELESAVADGAEAEGLPRPTCAAAR